MRKKKQLWIGLVGADQCEDVSFLGDAKGAYAHVVASARDAAEFKQKVGRALDELGLQLVELEDVEPLNTRLSREIATQEVADMADTVRRLDSIAFGTFYKYEN